jgi:pyruvate dehydrogenase E2 component (dihydrolipoamide acetyltransferase)
MPTDVVMPQMGESIFEGTITKWLKQPGDRVEKDEPLFEISTDKVDAEIPSPVAGVLAEIKIPEGATVPVNTVVGIVSDSVAAPEPPPTASKLSAPQATQPAAPLPGPKPAPRQASAPPPSGQTEVVMPQMGESIFEGTITKWLKNVGDPVEKDEPLFEISTDKVDAEIPSPVVGVLAEIRSAEGATVPVNTVVAVIAPTGATAASAPARPSEPQPYAQPTPGKPAEAGAPTPTSPPAAPANRETGSEAAAEPGHHVRSSPLVRRIAREHDVDLAHVPGSGSEGRITKQDILGYLSEQASGSTAASSAPQARSAAPQVPPAARSAPPQVATPPQVAQTAEPMNGELVPLSRMRAIIAQRMVESVQISPHVHTVYKVDMTRIVRLRESAKASFEQRHGVKLTYMPFIATAVIAALRKFPVVNASLVDGPQGKSIQYHPHIHLGIAVALEWGLIVPVVREAEQQSFAGIARAIADLAARARAKKLSPDEVGGSTFTLTNSGVYGEEFGTPIINQPESAILAIGSLRKEPVVLTGPDGADAIAIRNVQYFCLGFDHRTIDGADAGKFMTEFKQALETWNREIE